MIVNKVWNGTSFINTDSDTVDGFHAAAIDSLYKNVFMSGHNGYQFTATTDTTSFAIPTNIFNHTKDAAKLFFEGLRLNTVEHYTLSGNTVALSFTLKAGESIFVEIVNSSYDYQELRNKPSIGNLADLHTLTKNTLVEAINEVYALAEAGGGGHGGTCTGGFATFTETHHRYTATTATSSVVIQDDITNKQVVVYQLGIRLMEGYEYEIVDGTINLALELEPNDYIDYVVISSSIDLFPEKEHVRYTAIGTTTQVTIKGDAVDKELEVYMNGARLFSGTDFTVNANILTLNTALEAEDYIDYIFEK